MMRQTLISAVMLTLAFLAGGSALHAADAPITLPEGMAIYIVVLHHGSGAPEPDVAALGGRLLESRLNRRVVMLPTTAADTLRTHEKVAMLQRIWSGESVDTWRDDGADGRAPLASVRAEAYAPAPTSGSPSWTRTYAYDGSGNITASGTDRFWYDTAGRLAKAQVNTTTEVYGYDPFGNLTWQSGGKPFTVDANTNRVSGVPYDAAGNVMGNGAGREYHYDAAGMMAGASRAAGLYDRMIYTPDDERIAIATRGHANAEDNRTTFRVRDFSGKVLREWEQQGTGPYKFWQRDYMYAAGTLIAGDRAVATTSASGPTTSGLRHFHLDHLGSTRLITRADAVRISTHDYLPFGTEATSVIQEYVAFGSADPVKFTGHERDYLRPQNLENDDYLDYMHARFNEGGWGRFSSVDPLLDIREALHEPQLWNRYSYVTNNPLKFTDPDGRYRTFYKEKPLHQADIANAPPLIKAVFLTQGRLLLAPVGEGAVAAVGALARSAFTNLTGLFLAMMQVGAAMTGAPAGPAVNLGSGGRPMPGAVNVDNIGPGFQGTMRQTQVAGDALALPFKSGSVGNVTAQNLPAQLLGQGGQKLAAELARTMQSGSTLKITTQTPRALQNFAKLLDKTYKDVVIKDGTLTAVRR